MLCSRLTLKKRRGPGNSHGPPARRKPHTPGYFPTLAPAHSVSWAGISQPVVGCFVIEQIHRNTDLNVGVSLLCSYKRVPSPCLRQVSGLPSKDFCCYEMQFPKVAEVFSVPFLFFSDEFPGRSPQLCPTIHRNLPVLHQPLLHQTLLVCLQLSG